VTKKRRTQPSPADNADNPITSIVAGLFDILGKGDVLEAELITAAAIGVLEMLSESDVRPGQILARMAKQDPSQADAALLRMLMLVGSPEVKAEAREAQADLAAAGIFPAEWVAQAGKPAPVRAWRRYDVFGDEEVVIVTYRYGEAEHALVVRISLTELPAVDDVTVEKDPADPAALGEIAASEFCEVQEIGLAEARRRIEPALDRGDIGRLLSYLPVARSRIRRLPADPDQVPARTAYTADDRAEAVAGFLASPYAAEVVRADEDAARFWAQVLTAYSGRVPDEPPGQVGPAKLEFMMTEVVPVYYSLTGAQRGHLRAAVLAWLSWSADHRGLSAAAGSYLTDQLSPILAGFDQAYDNPESAGGRAYVADVARPDADFGWLSEQGLRRSIAMPLPWDRDEDLDVDDLDATDPAGRRAYVTAEFGSCAGARDDPEEFLAAVHRVVEELWTGEPAATWTRASELLGQDLDRHDVIHVLAGRH
jgi:hypothetical protein